MPGAILALIEDYEKQYSPLRGREKTVLLARWRTFFSLLLLDVLLCFFIIGPAVVVIWRGVWDLSAKLLEEQGVDKYLSNILSLVFGFIITVLIDIFHCNISSSAGQPGTLTHTAATRIYSFVWGVVDINLWKGVWDGLDLVAGNHWKVSISSLSLGVITLTLSGALKSGLSMPIGICIDSPEGHLYSSTYLYTSSKDPMYRRVADGIISQLLEVCVILTWHGVWTLMDEIHLNILGWSMASTTLFCMVCGLVGTLVIFLFQLLLVYLAQSINKKEKPPIWWTGINFIYTMIGVFVTICCFRSVWYCFDEYYLPDNKYMNYITSAIIGWFVLWSLGCCSNLHAGIFKDDPKLGISIAFYYLSHKFVETLQLQPDLKVKEQTKNVAKNSTKNNCTIEKEKYAKEDCKEKNQNYEEEKDIFLEGKENCTKEKELFKAVPEQIIECEITKL